MSRLLIKLVGAGLLCGGLLSFSGKGAQREILRFGCACLMILLLLSGLREAPLQLPDLSLYENQAEDRIRLAQDESRQNLFLEVKSGLEKQIQVQASILQIQCKTELDCAADPDGSFRITRVAIDYIAGPRAALPQLQQTVAQILAVSPEIVMIREAET